MAIAKQAIHLQEQARLKLLNAPSYDPVRADFDRQEARLMNRRATALLTPSEPLRAALGGEIFPPEGLGLTGLETALKSPDMLSVEATIQRTALADRAGVFELAIEAAESAKAKGAIQQMLCHQLAAAHKHAMRLLGESEAEKDIAHKCRLVGTASRLMESYAKGAQALERLQTGSSQVVTVQHVQINGGQTVISRGG